MLTFFLFFAVLAFGPAVFASPDADVHAAITSGLPPPLLFEDESLPAGVVPEYTRILLENLKRKGTISLLPRKRALNSLENGTVDFLCYFSKEWIEEPDRLLWTDILFMKREVILGPAPMPKLIKDLKGKAMGTMLGYTYPKLEGLFKSKDLVREDGPNDKSNFNKLNDQRIHYLVTDEVFLDYAKKTLPNLEQGRGRLFLQQYPLSCALSKKSKVTVAEMNVAIAKLRNSGKLEAIFKKHGLSIHLK